MYYACHVSNLLINIKARGLPTYEKEGDHCITFPYYKKKLANE